MTRKYFIAENISCPLAFPLVSLSSNELLIPKETWSKPKPRVCILSSTYTMSFSLTVVVTTLCFVILFLSEMCMNTLLPYASLILPLRLFFLFLLPLELARKIISIIKTQPIVIKFLPFPVPFLLVQFFSIKTQHHTVGFVIPRYFALKLQGGHRQHT